MIDNAAIRMNMGEVVAAERITGINDNMTQCHYHDFFEIYYLEEGERYHVTDQNITKIKAGDFIIFPPFSMHRSFGDLNVGFKRIVFYFRKDILETSIREHLLDNGIAIYSPQGREANKLHALINDIYMEELSMDQYSQSMKISRLNIFLTSLFRENTRFKAPEYEDRITRVLEYINNNYSSNITLEELGKVANTSIYHLSREFKRYTNTTIIVYINKIRILHAERLFLESDMNLTEIAFTVGYTNLNHFSRTFKQITGESPLRMKQKMKNANSEKNREVI